MPEPIDEPCMIFQIEPCTYLLDEQACGQKLERAVAAGQIAAASAAALLAKWRGRRTISVAREAA